VLWSFLQRKRLNGILTDSGQSDRTESDFVGKFGVFNEKPLFAHSSHNFHLFTIPWCNTADYAVHGKGWKRLKFIQSVEKVWSIKCDYQRNGPYRLIVASRIPAGIDALLLQRLVRLRYLEWKSKYCLLWRRWPLRWLEKKLHSLKRFGPDSAAFEHDNKLHNKNGFVLVSGLRETPVLPYAYI